MKEIYANNVKKMLRLLISLVLVFTTLALVSGCDKNNQDDDVDIYLNNEMMSLIVGEERKIGYSTSDNGTGVEWSSDNSSVASVDANGVVRANSVGSATITANYKGVPATCRVEVRTDQIPATGIQLTTPSTSLEVGKTLTVTAKLTPSNTTDSLELTSSDDDVATVTSAGLVKGVGPGKVEIIATSSNGKTAKVTINVVKPVSGISLSEKSISVGINESKTIIATVTPADASNKTVTWKSANSNIAIVNNGKITGKSGGTTTITATSGGKSAEVKVTVTSNGVKEIKLNRENIGLLTGATFQMYYVLTPANPESTTITWVSSNSNVASVDSKTGKITAKSVGTATITASATNGKTAKCTVYVLGAAVANTKVTAKTISSDNTNVIYNGQSLYIQTKLEPANSTAAVTYSSGNTSIVTVDKNTGKVTGKAPGKTTVTISAGGRKTAVDVEVKQHVTKLAITSKTKGVTISGTTITVDYSTAKSVALSAVVTPTNASNKTVKWQTQENNAKVASINASNGTLTINGPGNTTVTAKAQDGSGVYVTYQVKVINPVNKITIKNGSEDVTGKTKLYNINKTSSITLTKVATAKTGDPTSNAVTWTSSDTKIATVSSKDGKCTVTFKTGGTVTITATAKDGSNVSAKTIVKTYTDGVNPLALEGPSELLKGNGGQFSVKLESKKKGVTYEWKSSDTKVATVDGTGLVKGVKAGKAKITVKITWITNPTGTTLKTNTKTLSKEVAVKTKIATKIAFSVTQKTIFTNLGDAKKTLDLTSLLKISPTDAYVGELNWKEIKDASNAIKLSSDGKVTANAVGSAEVNVETTKLSPKLTSEKTLKIIVRKGVEKITLMNGTNKVGTGHTLSKGKTLTLTASVTPTDATLKTVTWTTSDKTVATVTSKGVVTGVKAGKATITATAKDGSGATAKVIFTIK